MVNPAFGSVTSVVHVVHDHISGEPINKDSLNWTIAKVPYHHGIKLLLYAEVNLLPGGVRLLQWEGVKQERGSIGTHMGVGHLEGPPQEGVVEA